jgi:6-phosphofructokinase 1
MRKGEMRRTAVLTSGGDAPGMNTGIRAAVRSSPDKGWEVVGIRHSYTGRIVGDHAILGVRDVGGIIQKGGTMLGSARCPEFKTEAGRREAVSVLGRLGIEGLIVIGDNGSRTGAYALVDIGLPVVGVASTINNDLYGSDITIGVDTA